MDSLDVFHHGGVAGSWLRAGYRWESSQGPLGPKREKFPAPHATRYITQQHLQRMQYNMTITMQIHDLITSSNREAHAHLIALRSDHHELLLDYVASHV